MAAPVIQSWTAQNTGGATRTNMDFVEPTGVVVGDLLIILAVSDQSNTTDWDTLDGWTRIVAANSSAGDCDLAIYWRIADGTEADPINVTAASTDERTGWYLRIDGHDGVDWNDVLGTPQTSGNGSSHDANEVTTTVDDCLVIAVFGYDGADMGTLSFSGTGWTMTDQEDSGSADTDVSGAFGSKTVATAGGSVECVLEHTANDDGATRVQFAVAPATAVASPTINLIMAPYISA